MELEVNNIFVLDGRFYIVRCKSDEHLVIERMDNMPELVELIINLYCATTRTTIMKCMLDEMEVA